MTQVDFYHLTRDPVERAIPAIAARIVKDGGRLLVVGAERSRLQAVSNALWDAGAESYLAHDFDDQLLPEVQPILLSEGIAASNGARFVALADGVWREEALGFDRAFYFFDEATIEGARAAWVALNKTDGLTVRFWKQDGGRWRQGP